MPRYSYIVLGNYLQVLVWIIRIITSFKGLPNGSPFHLNQTGEIIMNTEINKEDEIHERDMSLTKGIIRKAIEEDLIQNDKF